MTLGFAYRRQLVKKCFAKSFRNVQVLNYWLNEFALFTKYHLHVVLKSQTQGALIMSKL